MAVKLELKHTKDFIREDEFKAIVPQVETAHKLLSSKTGPGNDFLGWLDLPINYDKEEFARIEAAAKRIQANSQVLIVIGIGGSYLGAAAALEFLKSPFYNNLKKDTPEIYFVGNNISGDYFNDILKLIEGKDVSVNVISKSGTTTEPAVAFRYFKAFMEKKYGKEGAKERIFATTDKARGTLKSLADKEGYETYVIEDDVGGRFSVLTAVGLLPIAVAGCDIRALMSGAAAAHSDFNDCDIEKNACYKYAAIRNILLRKGFALEMVVYYEPACRMLSEWFKQLYGESEGKDSKGLFPVSAGFSTDLHSLGQFIQDGSRIMFETVLDIKKPKSDTEILHDELNGDGLNFLSGMNMSYVNRKAMEGTIVAHTEEGRVPNIIIEVDDFSEYSLGYLLYFYMKACAISGYILSVNPFDQPGVESYKRNMFALLGKPGFEELQAQLLLKLK